MSRATADRIGSEGDLTASEAIYQEVIGAPPDLASPGTAGESVAEPAERMQDEVVRKWPIENNPDVISARFRRERGRAPDRRCREGQLLPEAFSDRRGPSQRELSAPRTTKPTWRAVSSKCPCRSISRAWSRARSARANRSAVQRKREVEEAARSAERFAIDAWAGLETARAQSESFRAEVRSNEIALEGVRQENAVGCAHDPGYPRRRAGIPRFPGQSGPRPARRDRRQLRPARRPWAGLTARNLRLAVEAIQSRRRTTWPYGTAGSAWMRLDNRAKDPPDLEDPNGLWTRDRMDPNWAIPLVIFQAPVVTRWLRPGGGRHR